MPPTFISTRSHSNRTGLDFMFAASQNPLPSLLLIWGLFGTVIGLGTRAVMIGKGRSGASGFWLGFFLGLLGLLIAALQSPTPEHEFRKQQQLMSMMGAAQRLPMHMTQAGPLAHAAQWAADPYGRHELRYFDGTNWTASVSNRGVTAVDYPG